MAEILETHQLEVHLVALAGVEEPRILLAAALGARAVPLLGVLHLLQLGLELGLGHLQVVQPLLPLALLNGAVVLDGFPSPWRGGA
jgi:hypothetical protein